eukprot:scaffold113361_cov54-Phaeocystis_antarctica.AAC.1
MSACGRACTWAPRSGRCPRRAATPRRSGCPRASPARPAAAEVLEPGGVVNHGRVTTLSVL